MIYFIMMASWVFFYFSQDSMNYFSNYYSNEQHHFISGLGWFLFIVVNLASFITHFALYTNQCNDLESLNKIGSDKIIYKERADMFLGQIKNLLCEVYPQHEKDIFTKITTQTASIILQVYPDIKAHKTITHYINKLIEFGDRAYQCDLNMNETIKQIEIRKRIAKLWVYPGFVPFTVEHKDYKKFYNK